MAPDSPIANAVAAWMMGTTAIETRRYLRKSLEKHIEMHMETLSQVVQLSICTLLWVATLNAHGVQFDFPAEPLSQSLD